MSKCAAIKPNGERCERIVGASQTYCYAHDPVRAGERRRNASRAGRSRQSGEVRDVKGQLQELVDGLLSGEVERAKAAVCGQLLNVKLRALALEREVRETDLLEQRIEELEDRAGRQWPA